MQSKVTGLNSTYEHVVFFLYHMCMIGAEKNFFIDNNWTHHFHTSYRIVLWHPNKLCMFSDWVETFSHLLNSETTNNIMSVFVLTRCVLNTKCVVISTSKYFSISIKIDTSIPQCNTSARFRFMVLCIFLDIFGFVRFSQFF